MMTNNEIIGLIRTCVELATDYVGNSEVAKMLRELADEWDY
jgi:hypothetical protein